MHPGASPKDPRAHSSPPEPTTTVVPFGCVGSLKNCSMSMVSSARAPFDQRTLPLVRPIEKVHVPAGSQQGPKKSAAHEFSNTDGSLQVAARPAFPVGAFVSGGASSEHAAKAKTVTK